MNKSNFKDSIKWYSENRIQYELLSGKVKNILKELLDSNDINYSIIEARAKEEESFKRKIKKGTSFNPKEMQDLAGVRIIGYVKSDVDKIVKIIRDLFEIDEKRSKDKSEILGTDKVGYRSVHFVAKFPKERIKLPEFKQFKGIQFEIQVRTILQHAWAEIQHDRNYKFNGILPKEIERRLSLLSGLLEVADNEFDNLSIIIDNSYNKVAEIIKSGKLDVPIDSTSLIPFLKEKFGDIPKIEFSFGFNENSKNIIEELNDMGLNTLEELNNIIPQNYVGILAKFAPKSIDGVNFSSIIRDLLIFKYKEKYFKDAWKEDWGAFEKSSLKIYQELGINVDEIKDILRKYNIDVY